MIVEKGFQLAGSLKINACKSIMNKIELKFDGLKGILSIPFDLDFACPPV